MYMYNTDCYFINLSSSSSSSSLKIDNISTNFQLQVHVSMPLVKDPDYEYLTYL